LTTRFIRVFLPAGRATTNDELEEMLESGNPAIFTQGVSEINPIKIHRFALIIS